LCSNKILIFLCVYRFKNKITEITEIIVEYDLGDDNQGTGYEVDYK
jgi:hypothetical protein